MIILLPFINFATPQGKRVSRFVWMSLLHENSQIRKTFGPN